MSEIKKPREELLDEQTEQVTGGNQEAAVKMRLAPVVVAWQNQGEQALTDNPS